MTCRSTRSWSSAGSPPPRPRKGSLPGRVGSRVRPSVAEGILLPQDRSRRRSMPSVPASCPGGGPTTAGASGLPRSFPPPPGRWWHGRSDERPSECLRCREKTMPPPPRPDGPMPWWRCALLAWGPIPIRIGPRWWCMPPWHPWRQGRGGASLEDGGVAHPETARRLACDARIQTVIEDEHGQPLALGRISREPSAAMVRQLRYRDTECRFPGCGARQFTQAHHIVWWKRGGTTDLANLVLICTFHHKLVHEHGWELRRDPSGEVRWFRPGGAPYHAGPDPPRQEVLGA